MSSITPSEIINNDEVQSLKEENQRLKDVVRDLIREFKWRMVDKEETTEFDLTMQEIETVERAREALGEISQ